VSLFIPEGISMPVYIKTILFLLYMSVKAYKFRICSDKNQQAALIFTLNTCRHLYNAAINIPNKVGQGMPELTPVEMFVRTSAKQDATDL
jgi:hypothetical protein